MPPPIGRRKIATDPTRGKFDVVRAGSSADPLRLAGVLGLFVPIFARFAVLDLVLGPVLVVRIAHRRGGGGGGGHRRRRIQYVAPTTTPTTTTAIRSPRSMLFTLAIARSIVSPKW
jgi:hypothetical protein